MADELEPASNTPPPDVLDVLVQAGAALLPTFGGPLAVFAEHERRRYYDRIRQAGEQVQGQCAEEAIRRAVEDERRATLVTRAVIALGASTFENHRRALREVVVALINGDDASVDDSELLFDALLAMRAAHAHLLTRLIDAPPDPRRAGEQQLLDPHVAERPGAILTLERIGAIGELDGLHPSTQSEWAQHRDRSLPLGYSFRVTELGRELYRLLDDEAS